MHTGKRKGFLFYPKAKNEYWRAATDSTATTQFKKKKVYLQQKKPL
jgi:hypothetical protein